MQFKALAVLSFATASLAAATGALEARGGSPGNKCTTGSLQCCNSTGQATDGPISTLLGLLGINVAGITGLVGLTCSGITGVGASGTNCNAQPVCCTNNSFNGLVALGCTPININL